MPRDGLLFGCQVGLDFAIENNSQLKDARINSNRSIPAKTRITRDVEGRSRTEFVLWAGSSFHVLVDELHMMLENLDTVVGCVLYSHTTPFSAFTAQENTFIEVVYSRKVNGIHHALLTIASGQTVHVETATP